jgi:MFS family permease
VIGYSVGGWPMWAAAAVGTITGAAVTPLLSVYGAELFATGRRGAANGILTAAGRAGAVVGLLVVGGLSQWLGRFGPAFAVVAVGPVVLVVLLVGWFPETARRSLEELNPADSGLAGPAP